MIKKIIILAVGVMVAGSLMAQTPREEYEAWK